MVDTRSERSLVHVVKPESWDIIRERIFALPDNVGHLIVVFGVPVIHPRLETVDKALEIFHKAKDGLNKSANAVVSKLPFTRGMIKSLKTTLGKKSVLDMIYFLLIGKTGLMSSMINHFGLPELADDCMDHWTYKGNLEERQKFVEMFQELSSSKKIRVTFMGGDVHTCAAGKFHSTAEVPHINDHRLVSFYFLTVFMLLFLDVSNNIISYC